MDTVTALLIVNSIGLLLVAMALLFRRKGPDGKALQNEIALAVDTRLIAFQSSIQQSVASTHQDVEKSNAALQKNSLEMHKAMTGLGTTIGQLVNQQQGASKLAEDLKSLLQSPKLRGNYGEEILEEMLSRVLPAGIWKPQFSIDGRETVDAVVEFKGVIFPIDAKFPRDDYERYLTADTDESKRRAWKAFEAAVKIQIDSIATKYIKPEKGTSDFALMFIPSEAVYYETIAARNGLNDENGLIDYAHARKVIPVSPNTFYAFLQVILIAVHNVDLLQNAKKLQEGLADVQYSFEKFYERFEEVGVHLVKAADAYGKGDDHVKRFKQRVDKVLDLEFEDGNQNLAIEAPTKPLAKIVASRKD